MNIILCGHKSCGKSTLGAALAKKFNLQFIDTDQRMIAAYQVEHGVQAPIREIHQVLGDAAFRALENRVIRSLAAYQRTIIATGGGAVIDPANVKHLKSLGCLVYLRVPAKVLFKRIVAETSLPTFIDPNNVEEDFKCYYESRHEIYQQVASVTINTDNKSEREILNNLTEND